MKTIADIAREENVRAWREERDAEKRLDRVRDRITNVLIVLTVAAPIAFLLAGWVLEAMTRQVPQHVIDRAQRSAMTDPL